MRRRAILGAATTMLAEMPVAQVTLNELSRRAGLAKSNVLRYFESREAVLLELLDSAWQDWLAQLDKDLEVAVDPAAPLPKRCDQLAAALASTLASRPMLCDLISTQGHDDRRAVAPHAALGRPARRLPGGSGPGRHAAGFHRDSPRGAPGDDRRHPGASGPLAVLPLRTERSRYIGASQDIAVVAPFRASYDARFVTGADIVVDGQSVVMPSNR